MGTVDKRHRSLSDMREVDAGKRFILSVDVARLLRERYGVTNMREDGEELRMKCPLPLGLHKHGDRTGKFSYNTKSHKLGCWVCGGGDVLWLIKHMEGGLTDVEAVAIAKEFAKELTDDEFDAMVRGEMVESDGSTTSVATKVYDSQVQKWAEYRHPYWKKRGLTVETCEMWQLGYDPKEDKVTIPHKFGRQVVGYQKRPVEWKATDTGPKWQNNPAFPKEGTLFNYDQAIKYDSVVVVEAPISAMYLWQCGIPNVVATFGTQMPPSQIRLMRRFSDVIVWFDPDVAGIHGTRTVLDGLVGHADTWVVNCVQGDPNEVEDNVLRTPEDVWDRVYRNGLVPGFLWEGGR